MRTKLEADCEVCGKQMLEGWDTNWPCRHIECLKGTAKPKFFTLSTDVTKGHGLPETDTVFNVSDARVQHNGRTKEVVPTK